MKIRHYLVNLTAIFFLSCGDLAQQLPPAITQNIQDIQQKYAPDKRVARFQVEAIPINRATILKGETNLPDAKTELLAALAKEKLPVIDSIQLLPSKDLNGEIYGIVNVSACNIRSVPKNSAELSTQATLGTVLRVQKQKDGWYLIQTPDDYFGWLDRGGFTSVSQEDLNQWMESEKVVYIKDFGFSFAEADEQSARVSDLLEGNILQFAGIEGNFAKARYPDGRIGYIPNDEVMNYDLWLSSRSPNPENILTKAHDMMGRPYLWGGTSGKGMDCSGFTKTVFYLNGIILQRDASQQVHTGVAIETDTTWKNLQAGDLLFFGEKATPEKKERIRHVAIYIGDGKIIHASKRIQTESLLYSDSLYNPYRVATFVRAKRMLTSVGENGVGLLAESPFY